MARGFPALFDQRHLAFVTGTPPHVLGTIRRQPERFYSEFRISKHSGGSRIISVPTPVLRGVQDWIYQHIGIAFEPHMACHGFVRGRSIVSNAAPHTGATVILKLDLTDFFGSVERRRIFSLFRRVGFSRTVSRLLTTMTTLNGALPQGAPTSPVLANMAAFRLDVRLAGLCRRHGIAYTRYADDLTFSGDAVTQARLKRGIERIIRNEGFRPNERKAHYLHREQRQAVTGIVVNDGLNWPRDRRRALRQEVYYLKRFGVDAHLERRGFGASRYKEHIYGHLYALNAVRRDEAQGLLAELDLVAWPY